MRRSKLVCAFRKARVTRQKRHRGKLGTVSDVYGRILRELDGPVDVLVVCYSSNAEMRRISGYERAGNRGCNSFRPKAGRVRISHHLAYLCSVFRPSPFCQAAVGSSTTREVRSPSAWKIGRRTRSPPMTGARSRPFTRKADREGLACLAKQLWRGERGRPVGLGMFYFLLTQAIFPGESNEGTVIELAPYGDRRARRLPDLHVACGEVGMPDALRGPAARPSSGPRSAGGASTWSTRTAPSPVIKAGPTAPSTIGGRRRARGRRHANMVRPAAASMLRSWASMLAATPSSPPAASTGCRSWRAPIRSSTVLHATPWTDSVAAEQGPSALLMRKSRRVHQGRDHRACVERSEHPRS